MTRTSRRRRRRTWIGAAAPIALALAFTGCSSSSSDDDAARVGSDPAGSVEELVDWYGKVQEIVASCSHASAVADGALDGHSESPQAVDGSATAVMVAGQAVENCRFALTNGSEPAATELPEAYAQVTTKVGEWLAVMGEANRAAVVVAAGNMDSRPLVAELYGHQVAADGLADEIDALLRVEAEPLGIEVPEGLSLYRWDPPDH